jgi:hypothetical protein
MDDLELVDLYALPRETARQAAFEDPDSIELPPGAMSLEFLQAIYRSAEQPMVRRMKAAIAALPYEHPKLAVTAVVDGTEDLGARLSRAIQRSAKVIELRAIAPVGQAMAMPSTARLLRFRRPQCAGQWPS